MTQRREKKSEMLEIRISHAEKQAFIARCRAEGRSASAVVRELVAGYSAGPARRSFPFMHRITAMTRTLAARPKRLLAAALAASTALAFGLSAPSGAEADPRAAFDLIDRDRDQAIDFAEMLDHILEEGLVVNPNARPGAPERLVSPDELEGAIRSEFARYDRDRNGSVTYAEFASYYVWRVDSVFAALDRDADGALDRAELSRSLGVYEGVTTQSRDQRVDHVLAQLDADRDGALSYDEFTAID
jgi:Ca2+-binding EF-hand superfamily protein